MTRCKVGDLAVVVRGDFPQNIGRIVRCLSPIESWRDPGISAWRVEVPGEPAVGYLPTGGIGPLGNPCFYDWELRPIRDPGDDAVDETLTALWLPAGETA